jgi:hypothetical protein
MSKNSDSTVTGNSWKWNESEIKICNFSQSENRKMWFFELP